jgi:hypothetical protein
MCQLLKQPTPQQPSMTQRCGGMSAATPKSVCHQGAFTYADAYKMGSQDSNAWVWVCSYLMKQNSSDCATDDPFARSDWKSAAILVVMFAGAVTCSLACLAAVPEAILFQATMDASVLTGDATLASIDGGAEYVSSRFLGILREDGGAVGDAEVEAAAEQTGFSCDSFTPDTPVLMADGSTKKIADVQVGDVVLATDPETGKTVAERVTALHNNLDHDFADVTVKDTNGRTSTIHTTANHRFWDDARHQWISAAQLNTKAKLRTATGSRVQVVGVLVLLGGRYMRNLTVAQLHTYYVLAGKTPVLVHNTGPCDPAIDVNDLKLSRTVQEHTSDITKSGTPARPFNESRLTMQEIMRGSTPRPDPGGVPGGLRWDTPGALNGKSGTWELVIDTRTNTVLHYNFTTR